MRGLFKKLYLYMINLSYMKLFITTQFRIIILLILAPVFISAQGEQTNNRNFENSMQSYLSDYSFTATQNCSGLPTYFTIDNTEGIDSVFWEFNDIGNFGTDTSTLLNPSYKFSSSGTFYPVLTVYSSNLQFTVTGTVIIYQSPAPNLGNDTMFCPHDPINLTLDAGPGELYYWNGSDIAGYSTFQVTDTGTYTVRVMDQGCSGYDTIYVSRYHEPIIDDTYLLVAPSNCGNSDGSITGIAINASYPYNIQWKDNAGNVVGTDLDLMNIPVGLYYLQVSYGENCLISFGSYIIQNVDAPLISHVVVFNDVCNMGTGAITVIPETGDPNEYWYSLNGGIDFIQNDGYFTGLHLGIYIVMIRNEAGCTNSTEPIFITNENIPLAFQIEVMPDYCGMNTGSITIIPEIGNSNEFWYSVNGGIDYVQNEGYFTGLAAGDYDVVIRNEVGCISANHPVLIAGIPCPVNVIGLPDLINTPLAEGMAVIIPPGGGPYTVEVDGSMQTVVNDTITGLFEGSHSITITNLYGFTLSLTLYIEGILGLDETHYAGSFTLFQEGSSDIFYLDSGTATISGKAYAEIRNISGQLIDKLPINKSRTEINLGAIPKGIYMLTVFSEKGIWSVKFVR
jgi:PKD repeat protein